MQFVSCHLGLPDGGHEKQLHQYLHYYNRWDGDFCCLSLHYGLEIGIIQ